MDDLNALLSELDKNLDLDPMKVEVPTFKVPDMAEVAKAKSNSVGNVLDPFGDNPFSLDPLNTGELLSAPIVNIERDEEEERKRAEAREKAKEDKDKGKKILITTINDPNKAREEERRRREEEEEAKKREEALRLGEKPPAPRRRRLEGASYWHRRAVDPELVLPNPVVPQAKPGNSAVTVHLADGTSCNVKYSPDFVAEDLVNNVASSLGMTQGYLFDICVPSSEGDFWLNRGGDLSGLTAGHKVSMKIRFWKAPRSLSCPVATRLIYFQVSAGVMSCQYPISLRTATKLAALKVAVEHGAYHEIVQQEKKVSLSELLPHRGLPEEYFWSRILAALRVQEGISKEEAMKAYVAIVRNTPMFGVQQFPVKFQGRNTKLGVAEDGFMMPHPEAGPTGEFISFEQLYRWDVKDETTFVLVRDTKRDAPIEFGCSAVGIEGIQDLCTSYYAMALDLNGDLPDLPLGFELEPSSFPDSKLYRPSMTRFAFEVTQVTRLHLFREHYLTGCEEDGVTPSARLISEVIDRALDDETVVDNLDCSNCGIDSKHLMTLVRALRNTFMEDISTYEHFEDNFVMTGINLSDNKLDKTSVDAIGELLTTENPFRVLMLKLNNNTIKKGGAVKLAPYLERYTLIKALHMRNTGMGDKGFEKIVDAMKFNGNLVLFDFEDNGIGDGAHKMLGNMMAKNGHLLVFNMSRNKLGETCGKWFTEGMKQNTVLQHLNFKDVGFGNGTCKKLVKWVERLEKVKKVELAGNNVGSNAAIILAKRIEVAPRLQVLNLNNGSIGSGGSKQFAESLGLAKALKDLDLGKNSFSGKVGEEFVESMGRNSSVSRYSLGGCSFSKDALNKMADVVCTSRNITFLDISGHDISGELATKWGEAIIAAPALAEINLSGCIKEKDLEPILTAVRNTPRIHTLHLCDSNYKNALNANLLGWLNDPDLELRHLHLQSTSIDNKIFAQFLTATHSWNNRWLQTLNVDSNKLDAKKPPLDTLFDRCPVEVIGVANNPKAGLPVYESFGDPIAAQSMISREFIL